MGLKDVRKERCNGVCMSFFKAIKDKLTPPKANVSLKLTETSFALGENVEGILSISSSEDFQATEIRCEIECVEEAKRLKRVYDERLHSYIEKQFNESAILYSGKPAVSGPLKMNNGYAGTFPLSVNIPAGGRPTYKSVDDNVTWLIKGVIAIDGRLDITSMKTEIQVLQPSAAPAVAVVKEVIRSRHDTVQVLWSSHATNRNNMPALRREKDSLGFSYPLGYARASHMPSPL